MVGADDKPISEFDHKKQKQVLQRMKTEQKLSSGSVHKGKTALRLYKDVCTELGQRINPALIYPLKLDLSAPCDLDILQAN